MKFDSLAVFEHTDWPAFLLDAAGHIRWSNACGGRLLGLKSPDETISFVSIWSKENEPDLALFLRSASQKKSFQGHFKIKTADGEKQFRVLTAVYTGAGDDNILIQLLDWALPGKNESSALDANVAHRQKLDCALKLARTVSLDFNNALTSILGHASLLLSKADPSHPWRGSLVEIEKSASKAAEIANDLANFSRQERDGRTQQAGNLNILLQRCVDVFRSQENDAVQWSLQLERKLFATAFDEAKLQQALMKILENAVQSISGCDGKVTVQTRNLEITEPLHDRTVKLAPGTYICIEVTDNGCGICPEDLPRIFEPFFTTKGSGHRGLGLAWVYGIVTNHGGGVAISSQKGTGTSARVYLPASKKTVKGGGAVEMSELCGVETVLIVDDEELLLNMAQMVLSSFGYRALTASGGRMALEILGKEPVDLVITDLVMPGMSGRELIDRIRKSSPQTRIICSSGYVRTVSDDEDELYLQKPFTAQELLRRVKDALTASPTA